MVSKSIRNGYVLALDVGEKRIGVAVASFIAQMPRPLVLVDNNEHRFENIAQLITDESISRIVIGLPRSLDGVETAQSQYVREFTDELSKNIQIPVSFAEETLSSIRADELRKYPEFKDASRDSLAACFILEEYFRTIEIKGDQN